MRLDEKKLYNKNRCDVFNHIIQNPGKHFSGIMRDLNLTKRGLGYHLERLVEEGLVMAKSKGIFKFYYPAGYKDAQKRLTPMQQKVFDILKEEPCSTEELADIMGKSRSSIEYHDKNISDMGFIVQRKVKGNTYHWYVE